MEVFSDYIVASFTAALIAGIGERIAPSGMKKYVTFIATLMLLIFLFTPIRSLGEELFQFADNVIPNQEAGDSSDDTYDEVLAITQKKAEESIRKHLIEHFDIQNEISVSLTMKLQENETILMTHILVKLSPQDWQIAEEAKAYLEKNFMTETEVLLL